MAWLGSRRLCRVGVVLRMYGYRSVRVKQFTECLNPKLEIPADGSVMHTQSQQSVVYGENFLTFVRFEHQANSNVQKAAVSSTCIDMCVIVVLNMSDSI